MSTLMIGYDLNKQKDYPKLIEAIQGLSGIWWSNLDSTWLVVCNYTASGVCNYLKQFIDADDELLVIDVTGRERSWIGFKTDAATWLKESYQ